MGTWFAGESFHSFEFNQTFQSVFFFSLEPHGKCFLILLERERTNFHLFWLSDLSISLCSFHHYVNSSCYFVWVILARFSTRFLTGSFLNMCPRYCNQEGTYLISMLQYRMSWCHLLFSLLLLCCRSYHGGRSSPFQAASSRRWV